MGQYERKIALKYLDTVENSACSRNDLLHILTFLLPLHDELDAEEFIEKYNICSFDDLAHYI